MPHAARLGDRHACPLTTPTAHEGGVIAGAGAASIVIERRPAALLGSTCACGPGPANLVTSGSATVTIERRPAARVGDGTSHGGCIVQGSSTVRIG